MSEGKRLTLFASVTKASLDFGVNAHYPVKDENACCNNYPWTHIQSPAPKFAITSIAFLEDLPFLPATVAGFGRP